MNGGPGCSSFTGLLQELGPCKAQPHGQDPVFNPYSWNSNASIIFLDQPVDVGFSWSDHGDKGIYTTEAAARDFYAFLQILFEAYSDTLGSSEFHIAGESYAGRYIPLFTDYIVKQNARVHEYVAQTSASCRGPSSLMPSLGHCLQNWKPQDQSRLHAHRERFHGPAPAVRFVCTGRLHQRNWVRPAHQRAGVHKAQGRDPALRAARQGLLRCVPLHFYRRREAPSN